MGEITGEVALVGVDGRLNPAAIGWGRSPFADTSGIGRGPRRSWGRTKRWEYWAVTTPTHVLALTVSSLDYAAVHEVWVLDRGTQRCWGETATVLPARGVQLPARLGGGPVRARATRLAIDVEPVGAPASGSVRLRARIPELSFDVTVTRPPDHDCLAVVVPFGGDRFQYTVKDVALPAAGELTIGDERIEVPAGRSWAVLDHGRGRWPYDVRWNWGAGSGASEGRTIGVQFGGRWTDGTGQTENGVLVDGRLHHLDEDLRWDYDLEEPEAPWRVSGGGVDARFTPAYVKRSRTNLGVISSRTDQCFGSWSGTLRTADDGTVGFDDLFGWAEDVHNRW